MNVDMEHMKSLIGEPVELKECTTEELEKLRTIYQEGLEMAKGVGQSTSEIIQNLENIEKILELRHKNI